MTNKQREDGRTHLEKTEWLKNRIKFNKKYLEDLNRMKTEEHNSSEGLSNGRRKWFNQEIEETENKIQELKEELNEVEQ